MNKRVKAGSILQIVDMLRGAADLVGRSPYPLVAAAERFGIGLDDWRFVLARKARDHVRAECGDRAPSALLLEAAQRLADHVTSKWPRRDLRCTVELGAL